MHLSETGMNIAEWSDLITATTTDTDLDRFARFINESHYPHSVIIDMSASDLTTKKYNSWIESGLNIITANKKAGSGPAADYQDLYQSVRNSNRYFLYETTVGAGLPILRTLKD